MDIANPLWNTWANDAGLLDLYRRRCRNEIEEMTCAAQAAEILSGLARPGESILDAGCGAGYYYWSLQRMGLELEYYGLDYTPEMIRMARDEMCRRAGLPEERFILDSINNLNRRFDNVICFNVLTYDPHYALPLERLLVNTGKRLLLRESMSDELIVRFVEDKYIDADRTHMKAYFNTYPAEEVEAFVQEYGFKTSWLIDRRSGGEVEYSCDIPHYWKILLAERIG